MNRGRRPHRGRGRDGRDQRLMLRAIDQAFGNFGRAREIYRQLLLDRANGHPLRPGAIPDRREFQRLEERFNDQERFEVRNAGYRRAGRPRVHWNIEERVIALARAFPVMGLRRIATRVGIAHMTVRRIIREEGLRPYRVQSVQALYPGDYRARRNFCRWMLQKLEGDPHFFERILFTDEASFSSTAIVNRQNLRIWAERNPRAMMQRVHQGRFSVNVWAGIIGNTLIGPVYLPLRLNSRNYLHFLQRDLMPRLRDMIPRHARHRIFFMHDGAPPHFGLQVRAFLNEMFGSRWLGRRPAPHLWPPRSPDLNPLDFFFWGALQAIVYREGRAIRTPVDLRRRIDEGVARLMRNRELLLRVSRNLEARLRACLRNGGRHVEAGEQARMLRAIGHDGSILWVPRRRRHQRPRHNEAGDD